MKNCITLIMKVSALQWSNLFYKWTFYWIFKAIQLKNIIGITESSKKIKLHWSWGSMHFKIVIFCIEELLIKIPMPYY